MHILFIDKYTLLRTGMRGFLEGQLKVSSFHEAISLKAAKPLLTSQRLDLVITDLDVTNEPYVNLIEMLRAMQRDVPILVYSALPDATYAVPVLRAGANGFVSKEAGLSEITAAIHAIVSGKKYVSVELQTRLLPGNAQQDNQWLENPLSKLSDREILIMNLVMQGKGTKEIAGSLDLKSNTISTYKKRLFDKIGVSTHIELSAKVTVLRTMQQAEAC